MYLASAFKASSVRHALACRFANARPELLVAKVDRIELFSVVGGGGGDDIDGGDGGDIDVDIDIDDSSDGCTLVPLYETALNGRITGLLRLPQQAAGGERDRVLVTLETPQVVILEWAPEELDGGGGGGGGAVRTVRSIRLEDRALRQCEIGHVAVLDAASGLVACYFYQGFCSIVPLLDGAVADEPFGAPFPELNVLAICFLTPASRKSEPPMKTTQSGMTTVQSEPQIRNDPKPTLAVLYRSAVGKRCVGLFEVDVAGHDLDLVRTIGESVVMDDETGANILIPVLSHGGGFIVVGEFLIAYYSPLSSFSNPSMHKVQTPTIFTHYATRHCSDKSQSWWLSDDLGGLYILTLHRDVPDLQLVGQTVIASSLVPLSTNSLFVASHFSDSTLYRIRDSNISTVQILNSLAPISDLIILPSSSRTQVVTCSGAYKDASLRVVSYGVNMTEIAIVEIGDKISAIFSVDNFILLSYIESTRIFKVSDDGGMEEMEQFDLGYATDRPTLLVHNKRQITSRGVTNGFSFNDVYLAAGTFEDRGCIMLASSHQLVILDNFGTAEQYRREFDQEIASLCCGNGYVGLGLWSGEINLLSLVDGSDIASFQSGDVPRSLAVVSFFPDQSPVNLFIARGDGSIVACEISDKGFSDRKTINLGTKPAKFKLWFREDSTALFAMADRPAIIHPNNQKKPCVSPLSSTDILDIAVLEARAFKGSLLVSKPQGLVVTQVDAIQRLHIQTITTGELVRRICHLPHADLLATLTMQITSHDVSSEIQTSFLRIYSQHTFEELDCFPLEANETGHSILTYWNSGEGEEYLVIGTGYNLPDEDESKSGRLLPFTLLQSQKLQIGTARPTDGTVYGLVRGAQDVMIAAVNSTVHVLTYSAGEWHAICKYRTPVLVSTLHSRSSLILVGDLMRSFTLLRYNESNESLEEVARDYGAFWITAATMVSDEQFIGADADGNISLFQRNVIDDKARLSISSEFHFGQMTNSFCLGALTTVENPNIEPIAVFGTVDGCLGIVAQLADGIYSLVAQLEENMRLAVPAVGALSHKDWRAYNSDRRKASEPKGFIDGDFVEKFLDFPSALKQNIVEGVGGGKSLNLPVDEVLDLIETLAQLH